MKIYRTLHGWLEDVSFGIDALLSRGREWKEAAKLWPGNPLTKSPTLNYVGPLAPALFCSGIQNHPCPKQATGPITLIRHETWGLRSQSPPKSGCMPWYELPTQSVQIPTTRPYRLPGSLPRCRDTLPQSLRPLRSYARAFESDQGSFHRGCR